ncbi:MAG TPA: zf-HC2 domain-containing protein [Polyangia bacterium]|nr:zf-HC2 domain-containing protein [Polyangia bacterium]
MSATPGVRCDDVTARLMELLYDELPAGERAALQAHIAGCARCQGEVESFQKTRAAARSVLAEPAPAGVRQRLIAAAMAASAATAPAMKPAAAPQTEATRDGDGFWAWLRQRWTLPTLATVGAMAVFLLGSRVFLNPDKTYRRGEDMAAPAPGAPTPPAPAPVVAPSPADDRAGSAERERAAGEVRAPAHAKAHADDAADSRLKPKRIAPAARLARRDQTPGEPPLDQVLGNRTSDEPHLAVGAGAGADKGAARVGAEGGAGVGSGAGVAGLAEPFPAASASAAADRETPTESLAESAARTTSRPSMRQRMAAAPAAGSPAAASPPPAPAAAAAPAPAPPAAQKKAAADDEPLPVRAERLFRERRWAEAAAAYEQLLRQFPQSPQAPQWRQRLTLARAGGSPAPAAQPTSAPASR